MFKTSYEEKNFVPAGTRVKLKLIVWTKQGRKLQIDKNMPPRKELKEPKQIHDWLVNWNKIITENGQQGSMILIGSGALLWHAYESGITTALTENSMDVDPITEDDSIAELGYEAGIGSEFEAKNGWHINLIPHDVLREFPIDWRTRVSTKSYGKLQVLVPSPADLFVPKLKRGESRDLRHYEWAKAVGLIE